MSTFKDKAPKDWGIDDTREWLDDFKKDSPAADENLDLFKWVGAKLVTMTKDTFEKYSPLFGSALYDNLQSLINNQQPQVQQEQPQRLSSTELLEFWSELIGAKVEGSFLKLQKGYFMGIMDRGSSLYIRPCYTKMWEKMQDSLQENRVGIIGNPGIGKTLFTFYILYQARLTHTSVIYESINSIPDVLYFTFSDGQPIVYKGNRESRFMLQFNPNTLYLVDTISPKEINARTILVTSPDPKVIKNFEKLPKATKIYMPIWKLSELSAVRPLYPRVTDNKFKELYDKWGGIPRFVLEYALDQTQQELMEIALSSKKLKKCLEGVNEIEAPKKATNKLIHYNITDDFISRKIQFASGYVLEQILFRLQTKALRIELSDFFQSKENFKSSLGGSLYESHVHAQFRKGGTFQVCSKRDTSFTSLIIPDNPSTYIFQKIEDLTSANSYAIPKVKNFPAIDGLFGFDYMFQVTLSDTHSPLKVKHLEKYLKYLRSQCRIGAKMHMVFVCPSRDGVYMNTTPYEFPPLSIKQKKEMYPNLNKKQIQEKRTTEFEKTYNLEQFVLVINAPEAEDIIYGVDEVHRLIDEEMEENEEIEENEEMEIDGSPCY